MTAKGFTEEAIKEASRKEISNPCTQRKLDVASKKVLNAEVLDEESRSDIRALLSMYLDDYRFQKDSIFYDVMARPKLKQFICFPLRTSFIPAYITLDRMVVNRHVLKAKKPVKDKTETWNQGIDKFLHFEGTIETNGVGVSIIKQNVATTRKKKNDDDTRYIEALTPAELAKTSGKCVLVDPGQRDVLYCMKETSTAKQKEILAFRKTNRSKRPRHFRILGKLTKPSMIKNAETLLSKMQSSTVDLDTFVKYIKTRASVNKILGQYYGNETQKSEEIYFPDS
ncbi:hypothetical protein BCV71DRAFT_278073 [Rhizopus microsporus]|uniref:Uncharacterized protein n=1 Tax=Rhizopus microsporus TaxID=58291 RepID=A0A1X0RN45_RHIZD|nr:hypothetical protein BCV71DRAFT_278073 [Rhizopus microsporus]